MSKVLTPLLSLREAVNIVGSQSATARLLGVTQAAVWGWLNRGTALPAEHVLALEAASGVSKHALRPDIYGADASPRAAQAKPANIDDSAMMPVR
jgi:DNA-binding transcriptional regulator YdaS (Cro superfamily)